MKKTTLAFVISLFTANALFATSSRADGPQHDQDPRWQPSHGQDNHRGSQPGAGHDNRPAVHAQPVDAREHHQPPRGHYQERDHFAWQGHDFRRGHPVPPDYRDGYRVDDWRERGLRQPPEGEHWAYIDGNYVLIAAATGIITSIILSSALHH
ncbi:hypothetical protein BL250_02365 [Erwinia sp. OLTSP20]|uniref:RcnB family protein n=1 Tax=unclassified Erwinia TaxID=2622719 RepID=UPI000C1A35C5|nr:MULTISPECIES: RcnB family protein [unclassified Erwinia]PIJ48812.1 hypothetical protein BV501_16175 [Erwinia sp. OAMSP11]PIJ69435.1 hypothetical protein BK416_15120 [Erwinia sp. OLSSP12]PIJ79269.1 hypothetical protein BLD47_15425 [Erwinia sp. OLCASP19]PIJ80795.1 hypothetical protein BLD46_14585 [Erwinia sp. OLMTSP26]PIJ82947.1 hypothetical protein BLD49_14480 [Erwinia sp. OLMDSP33]